MGKSTTTARRKSTHRKSSPRRRKPTTARQLASTARRIAAHPATADLVRVGVYGGVAALEVAFPASTLLGRSAIALGVRLVDHHGVERAVALIARAR